MFKKLTTVIDFGSQSLTALAGKMGKSGLEIVGSAEVEYGGFLDGEFLELEKLGSAIKQVIVKLEQNIKMSIKEVFIGVPSAFCTIKTKKVTQNFEKKIKINNKVIQELYCIGDDFDKFTSHEVISTNIITCVLDDGEEHKDILNKTSSLIKAKLAFVLCEYRFLNLVTNLTKLLGVKIKKFILSSLAQTKYLFKNIGDENAVFIDVGHITTSVNYVKHQSIVSMNEFSLGGGFITFDLMEKLNLPYDVADNLKKKVVLSFTPQTNDIYEVKGKKEIFEISAISANNIVRDRIIKIVKVINKSLQLNSALVQENVHFYLCGGGISYIKGAKDLLSNAISANVDLLIPDIPQIDKPHYTSPISLLYTACNYQDLKIHL